MVGTGKDGRILKEDIIRFLAKQTGAILPYEVQKIPTPVISTAETPPKEETPIMAIPQHIFSGKDRTEPLNGEFECVPRSWMSVNDIQKYIGNTLQYGSLVNIS